MWAFNSTILFKSETSELLSFLLLEVVEASLEHVLKLAILKYLILYLTNLLHHFIIWCINSKLLVLPLHFYTLIFTLSFNRLKFTSYRVVLFFLLLIKLMQKSQHLHYILILFFEINLFLDYTSNLECIITIIWIIKSLRVFKVIINSRIWCIVASICQVLLVLKVNQILLFHYVRHCFVYHSCKALVTNCFARGVHGCELFFISVHWNFFLRIGFVLEEI